MQRKALKRKRPQPLKTAANNKKSKFDVYGSYTGVSLYDTFDKPVQDVDDL